MQQISPGSCTTTKKRVGILGDSLNLSEKIGALTAEAEESPLKIKERMLNIGQL